VATTTIPKANAAVESARQRRVARAGEQQVRIEWFIDNVSSKVAISMRNRVRLAAQYLKSRITRNISRPVTKGRGPRGGRVVTGRSVSGEFPKADTTQLMKTLMDGVIESSPGVFDGWVGTPLDYGVILELRMNRSFLVRTLREESSTVTALLTGPVV
jgi:hypothetical protein